MLVKYSSIGNRKPGVDKLISGLALGGGGSKGIYELGAWEAFRELGVVFDVIAGTSIGSINGAFMATDDYDGAVRMWENIRIEQCVAFSENQSLRSSDLLSLKNVEVLAKELLTQGALNTQPLRSLLGQHIDEERVRESHIRYGLMTALLPRMTPMPMWIEDIPKGQLIDYVMASACLPGLRTVQIGEQRFIDGGVAEVVPLSMLRRLGICRITALDLNTGVSLKSPMIDNIQLTFIHNQMDLGGPLDLTPEILIRNRRLGYLDTLKAFGRLAGDYYSFKPDDHKALCREFGPENVHGLEQAAIAYEIDRCVIYDPNRFLTLIRTRRAEVQTLYEDKRRLLQIDHKLRSVMSGRLKVLKLLPPMRLAFLLELGTQIRRSDSFLNIPMQHFRNLDLAAQALGSLDEYDMRRDSKG